MYNEIERLEQMNGWHRKDIAMSWGRTKTFLTRNNLKGTLSGGKGTLYDFGQIASCQRGECHRS